MILNYFLANIFIKTVNDTIEPCDDFFKYVCGRQNFQERSHPSKREFYTNAQERLLVKQYEGI